MAVWIAQNLGNIITGILLLLMIFFIVRKMVKDRKSGKGSCSCGCENCTSAAYCKTKIEK